MVTNTGINEEWVVEQWKLLKQDKIYLKAVQYYFHGAAMATFSLGHREAAYDYWTLSDLLSVLENTNDY